MAGGIYVFLMLLIMSYGLVCSPSRENKKARRSFLTFSFVLMVLLLGCRNGVSSYSSDVNNYYRMFEIAIETDSLNSYLNVYSVETGYLVFNWLLSRFIRWPQAILFVHAIVCTYFTFRFIDKHSNDLIMTMLCYMSFGGFLFYSTAFRQGIAISLCLFAIEFAEQKKFFKFCLIVLLASSIHQTAIVFLPVYFMLNFQVNKLTALLDIGIVGLITVYSSRLIAMGNKAFGMEYGQTAYSGTFIGGIINIAFGVFTIFFVFLSMNNRVVLGPHIANSTSEPSKEGNSGVSYNLFHILVVGTTLYAMRFSFLILERISFYFFTPALYVVFPQIINKSFGRMEHGAIRAIIYIALLFLLFWRYRDITYLPFWAT